MWNQYIFKSNPIYMSVLYHLLPAWRSPRSFLYVLIVAVSHSINRDSARVDMTQGDWRSRERDYWALKAMPWRPRFFQSLSWYLGPCSTTLTIKYYNIPMDKQHKVTIQTATYDTGISYQLLMDIPGKFRLSNWTTDYAGTRTFKLKVMIKY